jgi:hypothetical protein
MKSRLVWTASLAAVALLGACGGGSSAPGDKPAAPAENDPDYRIEHVRNWLLVGNAVTPGHDSIEMQVFAPGGVDTVDVWLDDQPGVRLERGEEGDFRQALDASGLPPGEHELLLSADGADTAFARLIVQRSHPLYVVVTNDWDDADNGDGSLEQQERLRGFHPELRMTHFVGPYTYTDPTITPERRELLTGWVLDQREQYGDEIGLHIHPWCNFVDTTGVPCRTEPSTVYSQGDETGYTVMCSAYSEEEFTEILLAADAIFEENGLGKPTSFRAGGWTADLGTLRALASADYLADASANNWARMEEWQGQMNGVLYTWNMENWASIGDTSQPYYPSEADILLAGEPAIPVLEVPDNGILVDYVTGAEMIDVFNANWDRETALDQPIVYSIGYHPPNFVSEYRVRLTEALTHAEQFLASQDAGPVVYATVSEMADVWPRPE